MTGLDRLQSDSSSGSRRSLVAAPGGSESCFDPGFGAPVKLGCRGAFSIGTDHQSVSSRCSVRILHDMISKFCPQKVELVRSIGFGGLLHIPLLKLKQINLKFSAWLMSRVDELSHSLYISEGSCIEFNKHDVSRVFGIPAGGHTILPKNAENSLCSGEVLVSGISAEAAHFRSIKAAQGIVSRQNNGNMNSTEQDEFRAAFVVYVMSILLAPAAKHDRVSEDYLHAVKNPSNISSYDWSEYVLRRLFDAVGKLKADIASNVKAPYMYGCSLFLQVLYLDSIDLGPLSMPHDEFPRIKLFTSDRIRSMIASDPLFNLDAYNIRVTWKPQLRQASGVCYHWARSKAMQSGSPDQESGLLALWEFSLSMTRVLKIAPEAAGPLFIAAAGCPDALKFMDVLLHLIEPYMNGFRYMPSISSKSWQFDTCSSRTPGGCNDPHCCSQLLNVQGKRKFGMGSGECSTSGNIVSPSTEWQQGSSIGCSFCTGIGRRLSVGYCLVQSLVAGEASPVDVCSDDVDIQAISAMARFYLLLTPVKRTRCSDLNLSPLYEEPGSAVSSADSSRLGVFPRTPWQIGFRWNIDTSTSHNLMKNISIVDESDQPWIAHFCQKYIEVSTLAVKVQFLGKLELELEMFDAAIRRQWRSQRFCVRRFKQIDDELYANEGSARWRHYVESDFMISLLAGRFNIMDPVQLSHFRGRHINYDLSLCRLFVFPVILQYRWACFAWRMDDNTIVVYDPCILLPPQPEITKTYSRVVRMLKSAMVTVSSVLFDRWFYEWQDARVEVFNQGNSHRPRWNRSGLMCLQFCRCFDGSKISPYLDMEKIDVLAGMILGEVSALAGNFGVVPNCIRQCLSLEK